MIQFLQDQVQSTINATEPTFRNKAYSQYLEQSQRDVTNLLAIVAQAIESDVLDSVSDFDLVSSSWSPLRAYVESMNEGGALRAIIESVDPTFVPLFYDPDYDVSGTPTTAMSRWWNWFPVNARLGGYYVSYWAVLLQIMISAEIDARGLQAGCFDVVLGKVGGTGITPCVAVYTTPPSGVDTGVSVQMAPKEVLSEIRAALDSNIMMSAALASSFIENVAERVRYFKDTLGRFFTASELDISSSLPYYQDLVSRADDPSALLDALTDQTGVETDDPEWSVQQSDVSQITGSSPIGPLDFSTVKNAVKATASVVKTAVRGLWAGIKKGVKTLWQKAKTWIAETFVDPYDLAVNDDKAIVGTINGWQFVREGHLIYSAYSSSDFDSTAIDGLQSVSPEMVKAAVLPYAGKYIKYQFVFGEVIIKFGQPLSPTAAFMPYTVAFKPSCVDLHTVMAAGAGSVISGSPEYLGNLRIDPSVDWSDFTAAVSRNPNPYVNVKEKSEVYAFNSLCAGLACLAGLNERIKSMRIQSPTSPSTAEIVVPTKLAGDTVTNVDFVRWASGWQGPGSDRFDYFISTGEGNLVRLHTGLDGSGFVDLFVLQRLQRLMDPLNWDFVPYMNNTATWESPRFRIVTTTEQQGAVNALLTTAVVAIVVVAATVAVGVTFKKVTAALARKKQARLTNALRKNASGEKLTFLEKRTLNKSLAKAKCSGSAIKGLKTAATSAMTESDEPTPLLCQIIASISGVDD